MRLVMVEWVDSYGSIGWQGIRDFKSRSLVCRSVGWLIRHDSDCMAVAPHVTEEGHAEAPPQAYGVMTIPARSVVRVLDLSLTAPPKPEPSS